MRHGRITRRYTVETVSRVTSTYRMEGSFSFDVYITGVFCVVLQQRRWPTCQCVKASDVTERFDYFVFVMSDADSNPDWKFVV